MKRRLAQILVCPIDRGPLMLEVLSTQKHTLSTDDRARAKELGIVPASLEEEIVAGLLVNERLGIAYPILNGVPRMLVFKNAAQDRFAAQHPNALNVRGRRFEWPALPSAPGEADVLRSFSAEWTNYDWKGDSYWNLKPEAWFRCMRAVLNAAPGSLHGKRVLEFGIGIGATADHLAKEERCELVGVDLGYATDSAQHHFGSNPFLHVVQASVFAPCFAEQSFDFVYSFGVIHHTYSTKAAFDQLSRLPKPGGRLYVWVYSPWDESRTPVRKLLMGLESVTRPWIARLPDRAQSAALLPFVPLYVAHQALRKWRSHDSTEVAYGFREAMHAARDRFAPRYIHRHSEEEVSAWFMASGYDQLLATSKRNLSEIPEAFVACTGIEGVRRRA
jgi:uncharacterized protein YbaR (Trm112 family)/SAM-dependent methyltransferase